MARRDRVLVVTAAVAASVVLLASCSGSGSGARSHRSTTTSPGTTASSTGPIPTAPPGLQGYLSVGPTQVIFFEWTENAGKINGSYNVLRAAGHQVAPLLRILSGTRKGNDVSVSVSGGPAWPGHIHDQTLTVRIPQAGGTRSVDFKPATHAEYDRAAQAFRDKVRAGA